MKLFSGRAHPELAEAVAKELKTDLVPTTARERLSECGAEEVITTDTLPQSTAGWSNLTVLSIAPLLAQTIHEIFENGSVTTLFDRA